MKQEKNLLVISNHDPKGWSEEQKKGWDRIDYIPFPYVSPRAPRMVTEFLAENLVKEIKKWMSQNPTGKVNLQGEFTVCSLVFMQYSRYYSPFTFPTTERVVEENTKTGVKTSVFKFVRWR